MVGKQIILAVTAIHRNIVWLVNLYTTYRFYCILNMTMTMTMKYIYLNPNLYIQ